MRDKIDELLVSNEDFNYTYTVGWQMPWWLSFIPYILLIVVFFILWSSMMNRSGLGGDKGVTKFSKARTRLGSEEKKKVTFADVAGADEEKEELQEIVDFLKNPQKYTALGAHIPLSLIHI